MTSHTYFTGRRSAKKDSRGPRTGRAGCVIPFARSGHDHGRCIGEALGAAAALCRARGVRLTALRRRVLELVWQSHAPVGAYALLRALGGNGRPAAPPTVYRALDFLVEQGLVHRLESLNAYVGCGAPGRAHASQFLICGRCRSVAELDDRRIGTAIAGSARDLGFAVSRATVEIFGHCPDCTAHGDAAVPGGEA